MYEKYCKNKVTAAGSGKTMGIFTKNEITLW
jgi:hypothetical protein